MYAMRDSDRRLLERYKALGTPEEIEAKLRSPLPPMKTQATRRCRCRTSSTKSTAGSRRRRGTNDTGLRELPKHEE